MQRYFLVGYMGAGKTTIGRLLARKMQLSFIDLDHFIEARYRMKIADIFASKGEDYFRKIEREMLREVATFENVVISTGGGVPCFFDNAELMKKEGISIYLKASPEALFSRLRQAKGQRPILKEKTDGELLEFIRKNLDIRSSYYEQSTLVFNAEELDSQHSVNKATEEIMKLLLLS